MFCLCWKHYTCIESVAKLVIYKPFTALQNTAYVYRKVRVMSLIITPIFNIQLWTIFFVWVLNGCWQTWMSNRCSFLYYFLHYNRENMMVLMSFLKKLWSSITLQSGYCTNLTQCHVFFQHAFSSVLINFVIWWENDSTLLCIIMFFLLYFWFNKSKCALNFL